MVAHFATILFTGFMIYSAVPGSSLFSWHPTLMTIAMMFLMFEAIMLFNQQSSLFLSWSRLIRGTIHGVMMFFGVVCAAGGFTAIYLNKDRNNKPHFQTWHSWFGVGTLCYLILQTIGGIGLKYYNIFRLPAKLVDMKLYHATSGLLAFTGISITVYLALFSDWFSSVADGTTWFACVACLSCMSLTVMMQVTSNYMPQTKKVPQNVDTRQKHGKKK
ncbi:transmembrane reductase CYB561D2-like [Mytilus trossulus]|uniref:transmembrane reductase CYB561D2-like n=1 Tax=Mytilus trossulus TaxID=6551 RepID=UPI003004C618